MSAWITAIGTIVLIIVAVAAYLHQTGRDSRLLAWLKRWRFRWPAFLLPSAQPLEISLEPVLQRVNSRPAELREFIAK